MSRPILVIMAVAFAGASLVLVQLRAAPKAAHTPTASEARAASPAQRELASTAASDPAAVRYVAVGGGATPEYTEISLEQDLALAQTALPGPGRVLFAGGSDSVSVRVHAPSDQRGTLLTRLGEVFDPRAARESRYRRPQLHAQAATAQNFEATLASTVRAGKEPLLIYVAAHGLQGATPRENHIELWAGEPITVLHLEELIREATRPLRFVIASCYSGGFGELAFAQADPESGPALARCGVFAGTWDRQTSGCDPNPDRRAQEGYSLHFLHALRGEDREGKALPLRTLDLDGDGKIGLLDAHTRARIASHSIDVPTTTSERFLREVIDQKAAPAHALLPEDVAVVKQLGARLALSNASAADKRLHDVSERLDALQDELDTSDQALERARSRLAAELLARWPVLHDAYHDEFASTLAGAAKEIEHVLKTAPAAEAYRRARDATDALAARANVLDVEEAELLRLVRAHETLGYAGALLAEGGVALLQYKTLLACERGAP